MGDKIFLGTYHYTFDDRNRINIPAKIASCFERNVIINKGLDGCLEVWSPQNFNSKLNKLMELSSNKKDTRIILRQFLANSMEIEIDKANRILIPQILKDEAKLHKEATIIGLGNRLEIWDKNKYLSFKRETDSQFESIAERIDEIK